jgi:O-antigen/teichoic acid export membrane protein
MTDFQPQPISERPGTAPRSGALTTLLTFGSNLVVAVLSLASVLIVSRALGPEGRGSVALLTTIASVTSWASTVGVQEANVNIGSAEPAMRGPLATNSVILGVLFGSVAAGALGAAGALYPPLVGHSRPSLIWLALASVPIQLVGTFLMRLLHADFRFAFANLAWIGAPLLNLSINAVYFALGSLSVRSAVVAWVAGQALQCLILLWAITRVDGFGPPSVVLARRCLRFGTKVYPATLMSFTSYRFDQWLLGALGTRRQLGLYSLAVSWSEALFFLPTAIAYAQRPRLVRGAPSDATQLAVSGFRVAVTSTVPLVFAMIVGAPLLCVTVFGSRFHGSIADLRVLALGAFGILSLKVLGNALTAQGRPLRQTAATGVVLIATIVLDVILIPLRGGFGASIASTVAYTVGGVAMVILFVRSTDATVRGLVPTRRDVAALGAAARRARLAERR